MIRDTNENDQNSLEIFRNRVRVNGAGVLQYVLMVVLAPPQAHAVFFEEANLRSENTMLRLAEFFNGFLMLHAKSLFLINDQQAKVLK